MRFSIIVPVYNVAPFLAECVESVLRQTYADYEIVLVDDGSTDNSPAMCDEFASRDRRIKALHKQNGGLSDARNVGVAHAQGDYIVFLDSDDYWDDCTALQRASDLIASHHDVDLIMFERKFLKHGRIIDGPVFDASMINGKSKVEIINYLVSVSRFNPSACAKFVKASLFSNHQLDFTKGIRSEDFDWNYKLMPLCQSIVALDRPFYVYRYREDSITKTISHSHLVDLASIVEKWHAQLPRTVTSSSELEAYMHTLAYLYAMIFSLVYFSDRKEELYHRLKPLDGLLKYDHSPKVHKVRMLYSLLGMRLTCWLLGLRNKRARAK